MHHFSVRAATLTGILAATFACGVPALAASTDYLLKLGGVKGETQDDKHKNQIEILSYSWGETRADVDGNGQADPLTDGVMILRNSATPDTEAHQRQKEIGAAPSAGGAAAKVNKVESISIKQKVAKDEAGQQRDYAKEPAGAASGGVRVAVGDVNGDGHAAHHKTGTLEYLNRNRQKTLSSPAPAGSLNVVVKPGHGLCTAGKSLGTLTLAGSGGRTFVLSGVTVAGCEAAAGRPTETVSLNYTKIE